MKKIALLAALFVVGCSSEITKGLVVDHAYYHDDLINWSGMDETKTVYFVSDSTSGKKLGIVPQWAAIGDSVDFTGPYNMPGSSKIFYLWQNGYATSLTPSQKDSVRREYKALRKAHGM